MLKGIDSRITPELLFALARMGHGDTIALVDRNFPAYSRGAQVQHFGGNVDDAVSVILGVMPLDTFVPFSVAKMVAEGGMATDEVGDAIARAVLNHEPDAKIEQVERFDFYRLADKAFTIVQTIEDRPYGCALLYKGLV